MITNDLEKLGFTTEEVNVYTSLLELGGGFVSTIAKKAGAHRVTTYNTLGNLERKGFIRKTKKRGVVFYYPISPKVILNQFEDSYKTAKELIPQLIDLQSKHSFKPKIQFFEGDEIWETFKDLLASKTEVIGYTNFEMAQKLFPGFLQDYGKLAFKNKVQHRLLCPNDDFHHDYIPEHLKERIDADLLEIFSINPAQFAFQNAQYIYENKVLSVSFDEDDLMGVIIESESNAETNRAIFNLAWLGATSFVAK